MVVRDLERRKGEIVDYHGLERKLYVLVVTK
jgi:hypothetical protein